MYSIPGPISSSIIRIWSELGTIRNLVLRPTLIPLHDLFSCSDDHRFSLLHWACREGRSNIVDMLIVRGARINATNLGDDTPLHLAAAHGHRDVVLMVRKNNLQASFKHDDKCF